jgi:hypothetical protein
MSIPVPLEGLRTAVADRGYRAYVLTVSGDGTPHVVHAALAWDGDRLATDIGRRSAANASARPVVSLLFPVRGDDDYSLIVDGIAAVEAHRLLVTPTRAVLHRPAAAPASPASGCEADCVPLFPTKGR